MARPVGRSLPIARVALVLGLAAAPATAIAQVAAVPRAAPTREEVDRFRPVESAPKSRLTVDGDIERSPCALADPAYAAIKLTLTEASFNNLGPVPAAELAETYKQYLGKELPISVVCDIRDAAATLLRAKGYLAAVQVPTQRIEGGKVRFEVLYARMTAVRVRGDAGANEKLVARYLSHLTGGEAFNSITAERYLLLTRDLPGLDVRLSLKPAGTAPGDMIGEVSVRRTAIEADANIQNYAPHENGPFGGQLRVQFNGLTGLGDRTQISAYTTADFKEQQVVQFGHDMAIGGEGLRIGGHFTYAWTQPGLGPNIPDVKARTLFANLEATYPFIRSQRLSLNGAIGFDYINQDVDFGGGPLSADRLRVAYARLDGDAVDTKGHGPGGTTLWHVGGSLEVRHGFDVFGASPDCAADRAACSAAGFVPPSLAGAKPTATLIRFSAVSELRLGRRFTVAVLPRGQYSSSPLFAFEQISAGNYTVGRGFDPGSITGDSGIGFAAEARLDRLMLLPKHDVSVQPYAFVDQAWTWTHGSPAGRDPLQVTSVGGGGRVSWADHARLDLTLAVPVRDAGRTRSGDVRVLVSLTTRLIPWRTR